MPNVLDLKVLVDGPRNAVVRLAGVLDTSDMAKAPILALADCLSNDQRNTLTGFRVDEVLCSASGNIQVALWWDATVPQLIGAFSAGADEICFKESGGLHPNSDAVGYTGTISAQTYGWAAPVQSFTMVLKLTKLY